MSPGEVFLLVVRWLHLLSAVAWVGGSLFYLLVLRPALRSSPGPATDFSTAAATEFRALVNICLVVLLVTGVILALDRLTEGVVEAPYVVTLGVKVVLSVWMFLQVQAQRRRSRVLEAFPHARKPAASRAVRVGRALSGYNAIAIVGIAVLFLSDLLEVLFERALSGAP